MSLVSLYSRSGAKAEAPDVGGNCRPGMSFRQWLLNAEILSWQAGQMVIVLYASVVFNDLNLRGFAEFHAP